MDYGLNEIKHIRKRLGLTQSDLAKKSGVSQSLIAKIEAGNIDPTYTKVQQIFNSLMLLEKKEISISEIVNKKVIVVNIGEEVKEIIRKMKKYGISQIPVLNNKHPVGVVSENSLLVKISKLDDPSQISKLKANEVMNECPPMIPITASYKVVTDLLKFYSIVLIMENNRLKGILTKSDLLNVLYKSK